jgi:Family of unknown function (DUF6166)
MYAGRIINEGEINDFDRVVTHDGKVIDPEVSLKVVNHSPTGFCWGYLGSGPAQLALAILLVHLKGDEERALALYQDFKSAVIARLPIDEDFVLTDQQVESAISAIDIARMKNA